MRMGTMSGAHTRNGGQTLLCPKHALRMTMANRIFRVKALSFDPHTITYHFRPFLE